MNGRLRFVRIAMLAMLLATLAGQAILPLRAHALATNGNVLIYKGAFALCARTLDDANPSNEKAVLTFKFPAVYASPAWHASFANQKQKVRVTARYHYAGADGKVNYNSGGVIETVEGTAGFDIDPETFDGITHQFTLPIYGPIYAISYVVDWLNVGNGVDGTTIHVQPNHVKLNGGAATQEVVDRCGPVAAPQISVLGAAEGTVNSTVKIRLRYVFNEYAGKKDLGTTVTWDGKPLALTQDGIIFGSIDNETFKVPASPKGPHTITVTRADGLTSTVNFTVKPRIKITPALGLRDSVVNVSLRGYAANEVVNIRWRKINGAYKTIATVTTSATGSANVDVKVPKFAPDGTQKVRGDGATSSAQTSVFQVSGGPFEPAAQRKPKPAKTPVPQPTETPSPTATPEATPIATDEPIATEVPADDPTATEVPAEDPVATEEPVQDPIATEEPAEDPVATEEPVDDPVSTEEPALDPTPEPDPAGSGETAAGDA